MDTLKINKLEVQDFQNISHVVLKIDGQTVTLKGKNGAGKSAILLALMTAIHGKGIFEKGFDYQELIRKAAGVENAKIRLDLGDGKDTVLTTKVSITQQDLYITINTYDESGKPKPVDGGASAFAKKLVGAISFDPQAFKSKTAKEKLQVVFDMCPGLQGDLEKIDALYQKIQTDRAEANRDIKRLQGVVDSMVIPDGTPDEPVDPVEITTELARIAEHNKGLEKIQNRRVDLKQQLETKIWKQGELAKQISGWKQQIIDLEKQIAGATETSAKIQSEIHKEDDEIIACELTIKDFIARDPAEAQQRLADVNKINDAVRAKKDRKKAEQELAAAKQLFSDGLKKMQGLDSQRIEVSLKHQMPLDGLSVQNGVLVYTDSETFQTRPIDTLSSGQFWTFATRLYCAINPRLRFMIMPNLNDLDRENADAAVAAAQAAGLQLITHETIADKDKVGLQIRITDGSIGAE